MDRKFYDHSQQNRGHCAPVYNTSEPLWEAVPGVFLVWSDFHFFSFIVMVSWFNEGKQVFETFIKS
ncbi:hypothetical protein GCM10010913_22670 [Paenibacillus aceti]|uniref:Uncharacterized protein n=1 Tax=Paenibacillus aceti TaxID=1820010 RepID=A0ABQ1VUW8_9BACL|nr:hypothetical protein GCM10010913_22670 [Paenibacillus aceti]